MLLCRSGQLNLCFENQSSLKSQSFNTIEVHFSLPLSVAGKCSASCGHSRAQLRDIHHPNTQQGRGVKGHPISVLLCLATELRPATAAQSSLAGTSQIATSACKGLETLLCACPRGEQSSVSGAGDVHRVPSLSRRCINDTSLIAKRTQCSRSPLHFLFFFFFLPHWLISSTSFKRCSPRLNF